MDERQQVILHTLNQRLPSHLFEPIMAYIKQNNLTTDDWGYLKALGSETLDDEQRLQWSDQAFADQKKLFRSLESQAFKQAQAKQSLITSRRS